MHNIYIYTDKQHDYMILPSTMVAFGCKLLSAEGLVEIHCMTVCILHMPVVAFTSWLKMIYKSIRVRYKKICHRGNGL